ncbi:MAG TPA: hypothetical protein VEI83_10515 [Acidimicrobiales bacterium]|nr:hypothetical protein [Acidimicrobiales bacterium]
MSAERSPLQRLLDVAFFAPTGLAITIREEFPKLVDKGRHRVEGQVHTARLVGQFAVQMGRQKMEEWTAAGGPAAPAGPTTHAGSAPGAATGGGERADDDAQEPAHGGVTGEGANGLGAPASGDGRAESSHLAIPGYDSLSASQVVQRLDGLSDRELEEVRSHERATRGRRTILSRVDQLLTGAPPGAG